MIRKIELSPDEKMVHCDHCGAEMAFAKEDVINTYSPWEEVDWNHELRFKGSHIICPFCGKEIRLILASRQYRKKGGKLYDND